jgi:hypothetical protein
MERAREHTMTDDHDETGRTNQSTNDTNRTNGKNDRNEVLTAQNVGFDIHALANQMVKDGWFGGSMSDPGIAEDYILMAAANSNIANELPEAGLRFWRAAKFRYELDRARKKFGRPPREDSTRDPGR